MSSSTPSSPLPSSSSSTSSSSPSPARPALVLHRSHHSATSSPPSSPAALQQQSAAAAAVSSRGGAPLHLNIPSHASNGGTNGVNSSSLPAARSLNNPSHNHPHAPVHPSALAISSSISSPSPISPYTESLIHRLGDDIDLVTPTALVSMLNLKGPRTPPSVVSPPAQSVQVDPLDLQLRQQQQQQQQQQQKAALPSAPIPTTSRLRNAILNPSLTPPALAPSIQLSSSPHDDSVAMSRTGSASSLRGAAFTPPKRKMSTHTTASAAVNLRQVAKKIGKVYLQWDAPPKSIMVVTKIHDPELVVFTRELSDWLIDIGMTVFVEDRLRDDVNFQSVLPPPMESAPDSPVCMTPVSAYMTPLSSMPPLYRSPVPVSYDGKLSSVDGVSNDISSLSDAATLDYGSSSKASSTAGTSPSSPKGELRFWKPADLEALSAAVNARTAPVPKPAFDLVVTLGGDGTVLYTASLFNGMAVPPIVPFDLGSLGFLACFSFGSAKEILSNVLLGSSGHSGSSTSLTAPDSGSSSKSNSPNLAPVSLSIDTSNGSLTRSSPIPPPSGSPRFAVNMRMRLACTVWRRLDTPPPSVTATGSSPHIAFFEGEWVRRAEVYDVLNELVVDRGPSPYMSQLELFVDDSHLTTMQADGLVVATPTGSTAYSLSANGSMVHPSVPTICVTPICPHTLSFRPMLLPDSIEFKVVVPARGSRTSTAWASFDGKNRTELCSGDFVSVTMSKYPVPTVCADDQSKDWIESLRRCLNFNVRTKQKEFIKK